MRTTIAAVALVLVVVLGVSPVMADECIAAPIYLENQYIPSGASANVPVTFSATTRGCADCAWTWTITRVDGALPTERYYFPNSLQYTFTRSGLYDVQLQVADRRSHCAGYRSQETYQQTIVVGGENLGGGGNCWQPRTTLTPTNVEGLMGSSHLLTASSAEGCSDCTYTFRIVKVSDEFGTSVNQEIPLGINDINPQTPWELFHTFAVPGFYHVYVTVANPASCVQDRYSGSGEAVAGVLINRPESQRGRGFNGNCQGPETVSLDVDQPFETSVVGGRTPGWAPIMSPGCSDCTYTWSIYKITPDTFVPYPSASENTFVQYGPSTFLHAFTEPGDYKINVMVRNPPECQNAPDRYVSMTANHRVLPASRTDSPGEIPGAVKTPYTVGIEPPGVVAIPDQNVVESAVVVVQPSDVNPLESFIKASAGGILKKNTSVVAAVVVTNKSQNAPAQTTKQAAPAFIPGLVAAAGLIAIALYRRK